MQPSLFLITMGKFSRFHDFVWCLLRYFGDILNQINAFPSLPSVCLLIMNEYRVYKTFLASIEITMFLFIIMLNSIGWFLNVKSTIDPGINPALLWAVSFYRNHLILFANNLLRNFLSMCNIGFLHYEWDWPVIFLFFCIFLITFLYWDQFGLKK